MAMLNNQMVMIVLLVKFQWKWKSLTSLTMTHGELIWFNGCYSDYGGVLRWNIGTQQYRKQYIIPLNIDHPPEAQRPWSSREWNHMLGPLYGVFFGGGGINWESIYVIWT